MIWKQALVFFRSLLPGVDGKMLTHSLWFLRYSLQLMSFCLKRLCLCVSEGQSRVQSDALWTCRVRQKSKLRDNKRFCVHDLRHQLCCFQNLMSGIAFASMKIHINCIPSRSDLLQMWHTDHVYGKQFGGIRAENENVWGPNVYGEQGMRQKRLYEACH